MASSLFGECWYRYTPRSWLFRLIPNPLSLVDGFGTRLHDCCRLQGWVPVLHRSAAVTIDIIWWIGSSYIRIWVQVVYKIPLTLVSTLLRLVPPNQHPILIDLYSTRWFNLKQSYSFLLSPSHPSSLDLCQQIHFDILRQSKKYGEYMSNDHLWLCPIYP